MDAPRIIVREQVAAVDSVAGDELAEALAAVPGALLSAEGWDWAIRIGPDRAYSLERIVADVRARRRRRRRRQSLRELSARRDLDDPVIELIDAGERRLSLLDDWSSLALETLRSIPGTRTVEAAGRTEVPLTRWTAAAIRDCVEAHSLRLSPAAARALAELSAPAEAAAALAHTQRADSGAQPEGLSMDPSGAMVVLVPGERLDLMRDFAALPGAKAWGETGRWVAPASPEAARLVRALTANHPDLAIAPEVTRWLDEAPRWIARLDVRPTRDGPLLVMRTRWGEPPAQLGELDGLVRGPEESTAPLSPANLRLLASIRDDEPEVSSTAEFDRALAWLDSNPKARKVPPAELDVVAEGRSRHYEVDGIWDLDAEGAFIAIEASVARRGEHAKADRLPIEAWPADRLARFIRARGLAHDAGRRAGHPRGAGGGRRLRSPHRPLQGPRRRGADRGAHAAS